MPVFSRRGTPAPSTVSDTVLMLSSFNWQARGREKRVSVVCCVLNLPNTRQFCDWAMADLPAVVSQQLQYTAWDCQCLAAWTAAYSEIRRQLSPAGKGGGADVHKAAHGPAGAWCSCVSCRLELLFFPVHLSTVDLRGVWNRAFIRLSTYRAWWFRF